MANDFEDNSGELQAKIISRRTKRQKGPKLCFNERLCAKINPFEKKLTATVRVSKFFSFLNQTVNKNNRVVYDTLQNKSVEDFFLSDKNRVRWKPWWGYTPPAECKLQKEVRIMFDFLNCFSSWKSFKNNYWNFHIFIGFNIFKYQFCFCLENYELEFFIFCDIYNFSKISDRVRFFYVYLPITWFWQVKEFLTLNIFARNCNICALECFETSNVSSKRLLNQNIIFFARKSDFSQTIFEWGKSSKLVVKKGMKGE